MSFARRGAVEIASVVLSHAAVGAIVHGLPSDSAVGAHAVHLPMTVLAFVVMVAVACRQTAFRSRLGGAAVLARRTAWLASYSAAETVMVDGFGWHLFHDPWLFLAPIGVLVACSGAALIATVGVAIWEALPRAGFDRPRVALHHGFSPATATWRARLWASSALGRAPPLTT
ncbi:hypothetical protein [Euzebya rosea]|uniref:hypothetical protein n=1 Tax=Euzebya rosea TaxID=2052804 RepID=UPI000D3E8C2A|nr:hypothetical protein [Euzebya rosea]